MLVDRGFIQGAGYESDEHGHPSFWKRHGNGLVEQYSSVAVDYGDLLESFWGPDTAGATLVQLERQDYPAVQRRRRPGAGAPMRHGWPDFVGEAARRCLAAPIRNLATLEKLMAEWCAVNWPSEPSTSDIRRWSSPIYKAFSHYWQQANDVAEPGAAAK